MSELPPSGNLRAAASRVAGWLERSLRSGTPGRAESRDWALWQAACGGDASSATQLVQGLTPQAYGLAMQILARREDAEDVVQEVFLRLWGSRPSDARGATLATYFNTIVINRCKSLLGRRRELSAAPDDIVELSDARQDLAAPATPSAPECRALHAAMARLAPRQRMALAMWAYADADIGEIARALELEPNAAHQLLHRAKSALQQQLREASP